LINEAVTFPDVVLMKDGHPIERTAYNVEMALWELLYELEDLTDKRNCRRALKKMRRSVRD
jgi:hypothetical protein